VKDLFTGERFPTEDGRTPFLFHSFGLTLDLEKIDCEALPGQPIGVENIGFWDEEPFGVPLKPFEDFSHHGDSSRTLDISLFTGVA